MSENDPWGTSGSEAKQEQLQVNTSAVSQPAIEKTGENKADIDSKSWRLLERLIDNVNREQKLTRRWGILFKSLTLIYLFALLGTLLWESGVDAMDVQSEPHVALIEVKGVIADDSEASADTIVGALRDAFKSDASIGVVLRINSPGGSPVQAGYVYDEIRRLRAIYPDKQIVAVISDIGASGGYYIASAADSIVANKASLVGSIGVISSGFGFVDLMEKLGVERRALTAGESKALLDPFQPLGHEQKQFWQSILDTTHKQFIDAVKVGRGDRLADDPKLFSGLIWTGEQALQLGLIDSLGSASSVARESFATERLVDYTYRPNAIERLAERLGVGVAAEFLQTLGVSSSPRLY